MKLTLGVLALIMTTQGWIGLWATADSVTEFADPEVTGTVAK